MTRVGLFGQISDINDHLFLSGAGVLKPEKLKQKKITCVINATTEEPNAYLPGNFVNDFMRKYLLFFVKKIIYFS